jgi:hypothetical protein
MHCGGGEGAVIECSPVAGASHSGPAKRTLLAQSRPEWSSQMTNQTSNERLVDQSRASAVYNDDGQSPGAVQCALLGGELD